MQGFRNWLALNEAMKTEKDIPKGIAVYYSQMRGNLDIWFGDDTHRELKTDPTPDEIDIKRLPRSDKPAGNIYCIPIETHTDDEWDAYRNDELDELPPTVLMVRNVQANGGWGPLLYELAMEMASYDGGGLIGDRERTDSLAMPVWRAFFKRSDIEKHPLPEHVHTNQQGFFGKEDLDVLNYRYMKQPARIETLKKMGLWLPGNTTKRHVA